MTEPRRFPPRLRINAGKAAAPRAWVNAQQRHDEKRGTASQRGYGAAWRKLRLVILNAEPLCRHCLARGVPVPAVEVDHIVPLRDGGDNARENLQPLCAKHHDIKTMRDLLLRKANKQ